jgi:hypothetical protein
MVACRSSSKYTWKNELITYFEQKFTMLGVAGKLVKYVVHLSKKKLRKTYFSSHKLSKQQTTSFWIQGNFRD